MFKKKPGIYCEDCTHYIPSESANKHPYFSKCARLFETSELPAPRVARVVEPLEYNKSCIDARKDKGDCGKQGKYWEKNHEQNIKA